MEGVLYSLIAAICWALNGIFYKKAVEEVSPFSANFHRTIIATLWFGLVALPVVHEVLYLDSLTLAVLIVSAVLSFYMGDSLYFASLKRTPVSIALPVSSTYPIFVVLLNPLFYGVQLTAIPFVSALLVFLSVLIVYGKKDEVRISGVILALSAAMCWALAILSLDYLTLKLSVPTVAFTRMLMTLAMLAPVAKVSELGNKNSFVYAGVLGGTLTFVGVFLFVSAVSISGSWKVAQPSATSPVIAALLGKIVFGEKIDIRTITAISLIVISTLLLLL